MTRAESVRHEAQFVVQGKTKACGFSQNGEIYYVVDEALKVTVQDAATGQTRAQLGPIIDPELLRLAPDGSAIAALVDSKSIGIWDASTGGLRATGNIDGKIEGPLRFLGDGLVVGFVRTDGSASVRSWDAKTGALRAAVAIEGEAAHARAAVCAGSSLYARYVPGDVQIIDMRAGGLARRLRMERHNDWFSPNPNPTQIAFSADCSALAIGDDLGTLSVFDVTTGKKRYTVSAHTAQSITRKRGPRFIAGYSYTVIGPGVVALAFSPDGRTLASGGGSFAGRGELKLWDAIHGEQLGELPAERGIVATLSFPADGTRSGALLSGSEHDAIGPPVAAELWDIRQARESAVLARDTVAVTRVSFSADSKRLATAAIDGTVRLWDTASSREIQAWQEQSNILALGWDANSGALLSAEERDGEITLWDLAGGNAMGRYGRYEKGMPFALSGDGFSVAVGGNRAWNRRTQRRKLSSTHQTTSLAFSDDGKVLAAGAEDGKIEVWNVDTEALSTCCLST